MNHLKKLCALILALCLLVPAFAITAAAAQDTVLFFDPVSPKVGETVTVKVQFNAKNIGAVDATLTYDNAMLEFLPDQSGNASGGSGSVKVAAVADKSGRSSLTVSVVFRAVKAGTGRVQVAIDEIYTFDKKAVSGFEGARANMTVKAGSGNVTAITTNKPTTTTTAKPTTTTGSGATSATTADGTSGDASQPTTAEPEAPVFELEAVEHYTLFTPDDTVDLPDSNAFTKTVLTYGGEAFDAWYSPAMSQDILLVCAAKGDNKPAWYLLNLSLSTFTLYDAVSTKTSTQSTVSTTAAVTTLPTTRPAVEDVPTDVEAQNAVLRIIVVALAAVVVVLLIVIIVMGRTLSANKNARH